MTDIDYPDVPMSESVGPQGRQAAALERIATALEQLVLNQMPENWQAVPQGSDLLPPDQLPPFPNAPSVNAGYPIVASVTNPPPVSVAPTASQQAFRESRDLPAQPFVNLATWTCPVHHKVKTVPAGVSQKSGKPYDAFLACPEPFCDEKPPRPVRR